MLETKHLNLKMNYTQIMHQLVLNEVCNIS